jgi:hypothetical protein
MDVTRSSIGVADTVLAIPGNKMNFRVAKVAGLARGPNERVPPPPRGDRAAAAAYLAAMIGDLAAMARRHDFEALTYILDMARLEAEGTVQRLDS